LTLDEFLSLAREAGLQNARVAHYKMEMENDRDEFQLWDRFVPQAHTRNARALAPS
jgi:hypothetical protein